MSLSRRDLFRGGAAFGLAAALGPRALAAPAAGRTFVLVHGAWHGGWCWRRVSDALRARGHRVFTPTLTGLGERAHLMSRDITLDTFGTDVGAAIEAEELEDVVLVGHSFAGSVLSILAERMPQRLNQLVYLDSLIIQPGKSVFDSLPPETVAQRKKTAQESSGGLSIPAPEAASFGVAEGPDAEWLRRRLTPHPIGTYESPLNIKGPIGGGLKRTYVHCSRPEYPSMAASREWVRAQPGWGWREFPTGHDCMITAPAALTDMLEALAREPARA